MVDKLSDLGELALIKRVRRWLASDDPRLLIGIGDDAAIIETGGPIAATTDALIEGVHFRRDWISPRDLGRKALAVNVSDIAAIGWRPTAALLALSVPPDAGLSDLKQFFMGLRDGARRWNCPIAGGDLTRAPQWSIAITVFGEPAVRRPGIVIATRNGAEPGQSIYITGRPGESGAGLIALARGVSAPRLIARHNRPEPRVAEAAVLAQTCRAGLAMLDVSDGIWCDSARIAEASSCALAIESAALPISPALRAFCKSHSIDPLQPVLFGGEDYELLFCTHTKPDKLRRAFLAHSIKTEITRIGRVVPGGGRYLLDSAGHIQNIADKTFSHF